VPQALLGNDPAAYHLSPCFQPVLKPNYSDFVDPEISESECIVQDGCHKHQFPGMPKVEFRVGLVVQQDAVGVLRVLQEGGVQWAGCVD